MEDKWGGGRGVGDGSRGSDSEKRQANGTPVNHMLSFTCTIIM